MVDHRYRPPRSPDASGRHLRGGTGADDNQVVTIHSLPFATLLVGLDLNDSALQLSVTDHVVSDGFVLIKSIVLDPNCFGPPNNDFTITTMNNKPPPGPLFSC